MGFNDFLGNSEAVSTIRGMLRRGSLPGALLFSGPAGVGKRTLASMAAKALNCERLKDDFCGECAKCIKTEEMLRLSSEDLERRREIKDASRRVESLIYFDVQLIAPITRFILAEQIREVRRTAYARPFELPKRVFIIDQAQAIHWQAADLLLKVLEEPPETATFILVCPNANELRATLRSRCQKIQFRPVEESIVRSILQQRRIPASQIELATRYAAGSVGLAQEINLPELLEKRKSWIAFFESTCRSEWNSLGGAEWKSFFDATKTLSSSDDLQESLWIGYKLLSDMLQIIGSGEGASLVNVDLAPRLQQWADHIGVAGLDRLRQGLDDAYRLRTRNINLQLSWEDLAFAISSEK